MNRPVIPTAARNPEATERSSHIGSRFLASLGMTLSLACGIRSPIRQQVILDFNEPKNVRVTAITTVDDKLVNTDEMRRRVTDMRDSLAHARDEWSIRFEPIDPIAERTVVEKQSGAITRTERSITISRAQLQRLFPDVTIETTTRDGYSELAIYPGASTRATRQQREQVQTTLHAWAIDAAKYLKSMQHLYAYLDGHPQRAKYVFTRLLESEDAPVLEQEQTLVEEVGRAADAITARLQSAEQDAVSIDEQFDRVFNPLPAEIVVKTPTLPQIREGFVSKDGQELIPHRGIVDALESLKGKWLWPDPMLMLQTRTEDEPEPTGESMAAMPRTAAMDVTPSDIEAAVIEQLKPANTYRLRWVDRQ